MILPFHTLHPPFWFILGGSLCEDLELFHSFKTSPRSSKSESGCESYACFTFGAAAVFVLAGCPGFSPDVRPLLSRGSLFCVESPDVRPLARMSGRRCPETLPKCCLCTPDVRHLAGCPGPQVWPDVRASARCPGPVTCFSVYVCAHFTTSGCPAPGPDVRPGTTTYTPTAIFSLPLYIAFFHPGRRLSNTFI